MKPEELIQKYLDTSCAKSGFLTCGGKSFYLFGKQCCEAVCRRVIIYSEGAELDTVTAENLLAVIRDDCCEVYIGGKRVLRLVGLLISYEIPLQPEPLFGVMTGGREYPAQSLQFSDGRIAELISTLTERRSSAEKINGKELSELVRSMELHEIKVLSGLYAAGTPVGKEIINGN